MSTSITSGAPLLLMSHLEMGREALVTGTGEVDMTSGLDLERYLAQFTDTPRMRVLLDFAAVTFIDTAGLQYITDAAELTGKHGGHLRFVAASAQVRRLLELFDREDLILPHRHLTIL